MTKLVQTHELKTDPQIFDAVLNGVKKWELRKLDRNYHRGDKLVLRETKYSGEEMANGKPLEYTGRELSANILYILDDIAAAHFPNGPALGDGWGILSIGNVLLR